MHFIRKIFFLLLLVGFHWKTQSRRDFTNEAARMETKNINRLTWRFYDFEIVLNLIVKTK